jgi:hypothetical protein
MAVVKRWPASSALDHFQFQVAAMLKVMRHGAIGVCD